MLYNRQFDVVIQIASDKTRKYTTDQMLKIDFDITKSTSGIGETADITVIGLPLEDIQYLCTILQPKSKDAPLERSFIRLSGGYADEYGILFEGGIFDVSPSLDTPDMSIKLTCTSGCENNKNVIFNIAEKNVSFKAVCQQLADKLGVPFESDIKADKTVASISISASCLQAIQTLRGFYPQEYSLYYTGGKLHLTDNQVGKRSVIKLSNASGLIGTPQPTIPGCTVKCLLRPSLEAGGIVEIESKKLPMTSGVYRISALQHVGSTRSDEFYSQMECNRYGVIQ